MRSQGNSQRGLPPCPLVLGQVGGSLHVRLGGARQRHYRLAHRQPLGFRLADQPHKDFPPAPTLPPKAAHNLGEVVVQRLGLRLQSCPLGRALLRDLRDELEDFFFALYKVAASLTRWLPCSLGKVSTTTCAGLTVPSSIAAAAWRASSSLSSASSRRLRDRK